MSSTTHVLTIDDDDDDGAGAGAGASSSSSAKSSRPTVSVCGLEAILLDVGRVVALNGYADECRRLPFVARDFYREEDYLMATKHVRYGEKERTRLHALARKGDERRVTKLLKVGADPNAADTDGVTPLHLASFMGHESVVRLLLAKGGASACERRTKDPRPDYLHDTEVAPADCHRVHWPEDVDDPLRDVIDVCGATPLHLAVQEGHTDVVRALLDRGADANSRLYVEDGPAAMERDYNPLIYTEGATPIHLACRKGHEGIVRLLLDRGASATNRVAETWTPLHFAAKYGHGRANIVRLLVDKGAHVNYRLGKGATPLFLASQIGDEAVARALLDDGADMSTTDSSRGQALAPLQVAAKFGRHAVIRLLVSRGALTVTPDRKTGSAIFVACEHGKVDTVRLLFDLGADAVRKPDECLLSIASERAHHDIVRLLVERGMMGRSSSGREAADRAVCSASRGGHDSILRYLVDYGGASVNVQGLGVNNHLMAPIHYAGMHGLEDIAKTLVSRGADVNVQTLGGGTALRFAAFNGHKGVARILLRAGASIDATSTTGWSPLHYASSRGSVDMVLFLIRKGASLHLKTPEGETALAIASRISSGADASRIFGTHEVVGIMREAVGR
jgi:ankyrin